LDYKEYQDMDNSVFYEETSNERFSIKCLLY